MRALLDVNVLIALLDSAHVHHEIAMAWLSSHRNQGWATCPFTQNGCVRIMSQPAYPAALPAAQVAQRLLSLCASPGHRFWPAKLSLLDSKVLDWTAIKGHRQVTDAYLLALAVQHGGSLATFDRAIVPAAVFGARAHNIAILQ